MAIFKCKMCGGNLEIIEGQSVCTCQFCGTEQTLPRLDSDRKTNLYDRANHFRRNNDFDKAMGIYEQILNEDNTDSEAYWSLVLCRYGIEYVEDPATHKRIPTINRAQYTSIYADENYKSALEYAETAQKIVYEQEARLIDEIQKGILAISEKEEPFDVFICYKETDDAGRRTPDSVLANDLYHQLTQEGFKVFFARITLEDKLGQEYEPYIFAALNSAKVMVVLGTKPDYFKAVWVRNEWSRFLALIRGGAKKMLIPAYKDMDPYDLPEEFSHLQAQDMTKLGFMQDLIRGIKKIIGADQAQTFTKETVVVQQGGGSGNPNALIKRGNMALEDGEWQKADEFFEEVLNQDAECAEAYIGKLLAKNKKSNIDLLTTYYIDKYESSETEELEACPEDTGRIKNSLSKNVVKDYLADSEIRKLYTFDRKYTSELSFRKQQKAKQLAEMSEEKLLGRARQYAEGDAKVALNKMFADVTAALDKRIAKAEKEDKEAIASVISSYNLHLSEADAKASELNNEARQMQEQDYQSRVSQMNKAKTIQDFENVGSLFKNMNGYKDTMSLADKCQKEADKLKEAERLDKERREAARRKEAERRAKKIKRIVAIVAVIAVVCIAVVIVVTKVIIPNNNYNAAVALLNNGKNAEAYKAFKNLNGYKDSDSQAEAILKENPTIPFVTAEEGDIVSFGNYNGSTEWIVLEKEDNKFLIISKYAIEKREYNTEREEVTWETCSLRKWLNNDYLSSAFSSDEKALIAATSVVNADNSGYGTDGGNDTTDQVFLLSIDEVDKYFSSDSERQATLIDGTSVKWWLRSHGYFSEFAAIVYSYGSVGEYGLNVYDENVAVRPALWIDISNH